MSLPLFTYVNIICGLLGTSLTFAMLVLVIWQSLSNRPNQWMALYMLTVVFWSVFGLAAHLAFAFQTNYEPYFYGAGIALIWNAYLLLILALVLDGRSLWQKPFWQGSLVLFGLNTAYLTIAFLGFREQVLVDVHMDRMVGFAYRLTPLAYGLYVLVYLTYGLAIYLLSQGQKAQSRNLFWGSLLTAVGPIVAFLPVIRLYLPPALLAGVGCFFFARAILQENLFGRMDKLTEQLRFNEERYRAASELMSDFTYVWRVEPDGALYLESAHENFFKLMGYELGEIQRVENWKVNVYPDDLPIARQREKRIAQGLADISEYRVICKDKSIRWMRDFGRPIMDATNTRVVRLIGAGQDITAFKETERALKESEEKHRLLLANLPLPVLALRPDMTILYCNEAYARFLDLSVGELQGQVLTDLFPIMKRTESYRGYLRAMETGEPQQVSGKMGTRFLLAHISPTPWGVLSVAEDITDRKLAEEAMALATMKTELLAKVSHEFRTPLNAIIGYVGMWEAGVKGPLTAVQQDLLARILANSERLLRQVDSMIDQSQIELGKIQLRVNTYSPQKLLDHLHAVLDGVAEPKGLALIGELLPGLPAEWRGDLQRTQQILVNLASNAIKFTAVGSVTVQIAPYNEVYWSMSVEDTGSGIPKASLPYIFDPFHQVDGSSTRGYEGIGLGLSIVKQLVTLMGGNISVVSEVGKGSRFVVILPFQPTVESAK